MIEQTKSYSLGEIVRLELIPGIDTIPKASRLVNSPIAGKILKAKAKPRGARGIQYRVKGANILTYIKSHEKTTHNS